MMYTLLLAEDEYSVRKAIINTINWEELGFQIIGEAENGLEALEIVEQYNPDVIITDIRMPFMGGIDLAKLVREINPITKIVFLTGFNDFDYAISAIKLNVIEYLSKPVTAKKMKETLTSIKIKLDEENSRLRNIELLRKSYTESLPIVRMGFLISLVTGSLVTTQIDSNIKKLSLNLKGPCYLIFTIGIDKKSISNSFIDIDSMDDIDVILNSLSNITKNIANKYLFNETFIYGENIVTILSDTEENIKNYSEILMFEIQQISNKNYGLTVTIGVSNLFQKLDKAKNEFENSLTALNYRLIMGTNKIIYLCDVEFKEGINFVFDGTREKMFRSILKTGQKEDLSLFIEGIFSDLKDQQASLSDFQVCIIEMFATLIKTAKNTIPNFTVNMGRNLNLITDIYKNQTIDEIKSWFESLCHKVMEYINLQRQDTTVILAHQGYDYIKVNYSNPELSLKSVSSHLHISSNYFSIIFKKIIGESFKNILIKIRMEKAHELLLTTNMRILEIAREVGYTDQHYFSYAFKKYYDISPSKMRLQQEDIMSEVDF